MIRPGGGSHRGLRIGRRPAAPDPEESDRLARFSGAPLTDPVTFGGGAEVAVVGRRAQTVAYGYLGVVEDYQNPQNGARWATLWVGLPNPVPALTIDHRAALGRPGVPVDGALPVSTGDAGFDSTYLCSAQDPSAGARLVAPELRAVLLQWTVQRLMFAGTRLLLRTFDGPGATVEVTTWLDAVAGQVLAATPGFSTRVLDPSGAAPGRPFPPGLNGPNE